MIDERIVQLRNFKAEAINEEAAKEIGQMSRKIRRDVLTMVMNANSGHIGGSLSSADIYLMLWLCADITPHNMHTEQRDRIVVSHGHTSPGLYSVLGNLGFFPIDEALQQFRKKSGSYEGHPSVQVPGVEWGSGSLGQGLSVGCGFALAAKIRKTSNRVFVVMGDGEQQKGQLMEAAAFAVKHGLDNLTGIIDVNRLQASGSTTDIMPTDLSARYRAAGWEVIDIDGHNYGEIYKALKFRTSRPVMVLANTVMSKGISFIEDNYEYHGKLLTEAELNRALEQLETPIVAANNRPVQAVDRKFPEAMVKSGPPISYEKSTDCRTAAGEALYSIIATNPDVPVAVLDCDLMESVKSMKVSKEFPGRFVECGIQEHNAATVAGALSKAGVIPFFLDFGVFGLDETYGQHRMNDTNGTALKLIITHCGLDVGEDGKTHQCLDYISLVNNLPGYKLIVPADANQTDRAIRYIASTPGNFVVAMGRSKVPALPFYSASYAFEYGRADWLAEGEDATIITTGNMVHRALRVAEEMSTVGVLNISSPKQIDVDAIRKASATGIVLTYEDHFIDSGLGNLVASVIAENGFSCSFKKLGVYKYGKSCSAEEQYPLQELDADSLKRTVNKMIRNNSFINK